VQYSGIPVDYLLEPLAMISIRDNFKGQLKSKVTLGVCVRNCERYIGEAIESILNQDYPHSLMELVFVDGDSEDSTRTIVEGSISKSDIKAKILRDSGRGLGYARNMVVANAGGDFILWVDGDMILSKGFVTKMVKFMEDHPEVGIAKGKLSLAPGANLTGTLEQYSRAAGHMIDYRSKKASWKVIGTSGSIYRIGVFSKSGLFDERFRGYGEDQDIEIRVRAAGWCLDTVETRYLDYERLGVTWKSLWSRYCLRGYYTRFFLLKYKGLLKHYRLFPPTAFLLGFLQSLALYKLTSRKSVFLMPFHSFFKMTAWYIGYIRAHPRIMEISLVTQGSERVYEIARSVLRARALNGENGFNDAVKPVVTLGVCVKNCEKSLPEAVESIMGQDYPHSLLRLVFVDDGSDDGTLVLLQKFASNVDFPAKVLHTKWQGLGHARNMVIANAEGDFILWVDGDMILQNNYVSQLVAFMEAHPEVGIAKGKQAFEAGGNLLATLEGFARAEGRLADYRSEKTRSKSLGTGGAIYRFDAMRDAGWFDERLQGYGEDQDLEIRVRTAGWLLDTVNVNFLDYERYSLTWAELWRRYWVRGYYTHCFNHKNPNMIKHYRMFPPAAFVFGVIHSFYIYRLTHRKEVFFLPFQFGFKMTGWYVGYLKGHADSYQPDNSFYFPKNVNTGCV
jgi:glycosyltransferase involved in cell wall biosynthesis